MKLCEYGCGKEAIYQFKNGKWCCSKSSNSCLSKKKSGKTGKAKGDIFVNPESLLCDYGCGNIAKYKFKNGKTCCKNSYKKCSGPKLGIPAWNKGLTIIDERVKNNSMKTTNTRKILFSEGKIIIWNKGKKDCCSIETRNKISNNNKGKHKNSDEFKQKLREKMLNGFAIKMIKAIKKVSKEEIKLRNIIKELYTNYEFQFKVFNYALDVAIPEYKIAIEYDGYYHFDSEEHIQYHKNRQKRIESEGWKFYKVTMFDKFPTLEEVKEKLDNLIKESNETANER